MASASSSALETFKEAHLEPMSTRNSRASARLSLPTGEPLQGSPPLSRATLELRNGMSWAISRAPGHPSHSARSATAFSAAVAKHSTAACGEPSWAKGSWQRPRQLRTLEAYYYHLIVT